VRKRGAKMNQKTLRYNLGESSDKFEQVLAIPNRYTNLAAVSEETQSAIEYISLIAYPSIDKQVNRADFADALLQAYLRIERDKVELKKCFVKPKQWHRLDSCLSIGKKRLLKSCVFWQAYTHYTNYLKSLNNSINKPNTWNNYLVRSLACYQKHDEGFGFDGYKANFQDVYDEHLNFPDVIQSDLKSMLRPARADWKITKQSLHLVYGLVKVFHKNGHLSLPCINLLISNPFWVTEATKLSQYKLSKYLLGNENRLPSMKTKIDPFKMPFLDLSYDPIFIRKGKIF
jgi:hypothetical protein